MGVLKLGITRMSCMGDWVACGSCGKDVLGSLECSCMPCMAIGILFGLVLGLPVLACMPCMAVGIPFGLVLGLPVLACMPCMAMGILLGLVLGIGFLDRIWILVLTFSLEIRFSRSKGEESKRVGIFL